MQKTKADLAHYRQGDVLIERVDSLPKGLKPVPRVNGCIVVALGSSNGNPHFFDEPKSAMLKDDDGIQYLDLKGKRIRGTFTVSERTNERGEEQVILVTADEGKVKFNVDDITDCGSTATVNGVFSLLKHAEHTPQAIVSGAAINVSQRGFSRGVSERVQD